MLKQLIFFCRFAIIEIRVVAVNALIRHFNPSIELINQ